MSSVIFECYLLADLTAHCSCFWHILLHRLTVLAVVNLLLTRLSDVGANSCTRDEFVSGTLVPRVHGESSVLDKPYPADFLE